MGQQSKQVGCPSKLNDELIAKAKEICSALFF